MLEIEWISGLKKKEGLMVNIEDVPSLMMNYCPNYHQVLLETEKLGIKHSR